MTRWMAGGSLILLLAACEPTTYSYDDGAPSAPRASSSTPSNTGGIRISGYGRVGVSVNR